MNTLEFIGFDETPLMVSGDTLGGAITALMEEIKDIHGDECLRLVKTKLAEIIDAYILNQLDYSHNDFSCPEEQFTIKFK